MKKEVYTKKEVINMFMDFYERVRHGDIEHQMWLLDETKAYLKARLDEHMTSKIVMIDLGKEAKTVGRDK